LSSQKVFSVGDKVVYPMHGAGIIEAIEQKEVLDRVEKYYIMRMPIGDLRVMIPMSSCDELGLREVIDEEGVRQVFEVLKAETTSMSQNWNRRYRANMEKIKTGDIFEVAEVVRNLSPGIAKKACPPVSGRCWKTPGKFSSASWCWRKTRRKSTWSSSSGNCWAKTTAKRDAAGRGGEETATRPDVALSVVPHRPRARPSSPPLYLGIGCLWLSDLSFFYSL